MKLMRLARRSARSAAAVAGAALLVGGLGAAPAGADDTEGPGPAAGDIDQPIFRAAHPDSYTTADPSGADTSNVQTQLTSNTQNRFFECGDTIVYFQVVPVADDAPDGESTITLDTAFETRFTMNDQVGITEVEAFLAFDDSSWVSDGEETIVGTVASGTWSDGEIDLISTVDDVEAGETIVVEYHATLTCGNPPGVINGNLHASNLGIQVCQEAGEGDCVSTGQGMQTVPLFANAVLVSVVPEAPVVTQSECVDGEPTEPTVVLPDDGAITYVADPEGPYEPGQEVTVTATLTQGFVWGEMPEGWEMTSDTEAVFVVQLEEIECDQIVVPEDPVVTQSECVDGEPTAPMVTLPEDGAITYMADPEGPYEPGQEVTVIAMLTEGHVWGEMPEGWEMTSDTEAVFVVQLDEIDCDVPVVPENPVVTQAECVDGEPTLPTLTLPEDGVITYVADPEGPYEPGQEVTVTAELAVGNAWGELPQGWVQIAHLKAEFTVQFDDIECEVPEPPTPPEPPKPEPPRPPLATTGPAESGLLAGSAALLVAAGVMLLVARRRLLDPR